MELTFEDFKDRANDKTLSKWEKIGFPDSYRKDTEKLIFNDILNKLELEHDHVKTILDIGCGCSDLVNYIIDYTELTHKSLCLIDSKEMLANIDDISHKKHVTLVPGYFPKVDLSSYGEVERFDAILVYSVLQYPFIEGSIFAFIHQCVTLLRSGGRLLLGDIPNTSKRERFLSSAAGEAFLRLNPDIGSNILLDHERHERIDDSIIFSILQRFRNFGCETYLIEQPAGLPFSNRRDDILIVKR